MIFPLKILTCGFKQRSFISARENYPKKKRFFFFFGATSRSTVLLPDWYGKIEQGQTAELIYQLTASAFWVASADRF